MRAPACQRHLEHTSITAGTEMGAGGPFAQRYRVSTISASEPKRGTVCERAQPFRMKIDTPNAQ